MGLCASDPIDNIPKSSFVVITTFFNPTKSVRRLNQYLRFEQNMLKSGCRLMTVELSFDGKFEATNPGNLNHIQLRTHQLMWFKENLINIVASRLPRDALYVGWFDGDIEFDNINWVRPTMRALEQFAVVQPFETCDFLGPSEECLRKDFSLGFTVASGRPVDPSRYHEWYPHPGYAWATKLSTFQQMNGLFDTCILGSGDLHFAFALLGRAHETIPVGVTDDYRNSVLAWAARVDQVVRKSVGYVPIRIRHLWHGSREDRQYVNRWNILVQHRFTPTFDLVRDHQMLLQFNFAGVDPVNRARLESLQGDILSYFRGRRDDENIVKGEDRRIIQSVPSATLVVRPVGPLQPVAPLQPGYQNQVIYSSYDVPTTAYVEHHHHHHGGPDYKPGFNPGFNPGYVGGQPGYAPPPGYNPGAPSHPGFNPGAPAPPGFNPGYNPHPGTTGPDFVPDLGGVTPIGHHNPGTTHGGFY